MVYILSIFVCLLAGALVYARFRYLRLHKQLVDRTERLLYEIDGWRYLQQRVQRETGLSSVEEVVQGYRRLCKGIGYSLHNWTTEHELRPERSIQLGVLGNMLREVASSMRLNAMPEAIANRPPQVMGWLPDHRYGTGASTLSEAPAAFGQLLDGLSLQQLMHLTVMLLDKAVSLDQALISMGICLLTPDHWGANRPPQSYKHGGRIGGQGKWFSMPDTTPTSADREEAEWRALVQPRKDAQAAEKAAW